MRYHTLFVLLLLLAATAFKLDYVISQPVLLSWLVVTPALVLAATVMLLNPEMIVVGGDLVTAGEALPNPEILPGAQV